MKKENTILRESVTIYGEQLHMELRKERTPLGNIIYYIYKVYEYENPVFEEQSGCWSDDNFEDAFTHFERVTGNRYTEHYRDFMREYDKTIKI